MRAALKPAEGAPPISVNLVAVFVFHLGPLAFWSGAVVAGGAEKRRRVVLQKGAAEKRRKEGRPLLLFLLSPALELKVTAFMVPSVFIAKRRPTNSKLLVSLPEHGLHWRLPLLDAPAADLLVAEVLLVDALAETSKHAVEVCELGLASRQSHSLGHFLKVLFIVAATDLVPVDPVYGRGRDPLLVQHVLEDGARLLARGDSHEIALNFPRRVVADKHVLGHPQLPVITVKIPVHAVDSVRRLLVVEFVCPLLLEVLSKAMAVARRNNDVHVLDLKKSAGEHAREAAEGVLAQPEQRGEGDANDGDPGLLLLGGGGGGTGGGGALARLAGNRPLQRRGPPRARAGAVVVALGLGLGRRRRREVARARGVALVLALEGVRAWRGRDGARRGRGRRGGGGGGHEWVGA